MKNEVNIISAPVPSTILKLKLPISYYLNLFTSQYRLSAKLNAWQTAMLKPIDDLLLCFQETNYRYAIDVAVGYQLDVLGLWIGVNRQVPFQPTGGVSPILNDSDYRMLLQATLMMNTWDGTMESLYKGWALLFPNVRLVIQDNQNMSANILYSGILSSIQTDLITHGMIVPRPEGVLYNYNSGGSTALPYFGFDLNTASIAGFDTGKWA